MKRSKYTFSSKEDDQKRVPGKKEKRSHETSLQTNISMQMAKNVNYTIP